MIELNNLPKKSKDIVRPIIRQSDDSEYVDREMIPFLQYDYSESRQSMTYERNPKLVNALAEPKIKVSKPVANNAIMHNPQEGVLMIYEQPSDLSSYQAPRDILEPKSSDPNILRDFVRTIKRRIEESKSYPQLARDARLEGRVVVRFTIMQDGQLAERPRLVTSSGADVLDNAAIEAIKRATPFPALPNSLGRESLQLRLPMSFQLDE
jgi:protein TonB